MNAREVVKLAARQIENPEAKSWLERDEWGSWEREAQELIEQTASQRARECISDEKAMEEFALRLGVRALGALLVSEKAKVSRAKKG